MLSAASTLVASVPVMRPADSADSALESTSRFSCVGVYAEIGDSGFFTYNRAVVGSCFMAALRTGARCDPVIDLRLQEADRVRGQSQWRWEGSAFHKAQNAAFQQARLCDHLRHADDVVPLGRWLVIPGHVGTSLGAWHGLQPAVTTSHCELVVTRRFADGRRIRIRGFSRHVQVHSPTG